MPTAALAPGPAAADGECTEAGTDEQQRQSRIHVIYSKMSFFADMVLHMRDVDYMDLHLQHFFKLTETAVAFPVPTSVNREALLFENEEGIATEVQEDLKDIYRWVCPKLDRVNPGIPNGKSLTKTVSGLLTRWRTHKWFADAVEAYEQLLPSLPVEKADEHLASVQAALKKIVPSDIIEFLPAGKICEWLESAAACLRSDMPRDYSFKISEDMLGLQRKLAGMQETAGVETREDNEKAGGPPGRPQVQDGTGETAQNLGNEPEEPSVQGAGHGRAGEQQHESQTSDDHAEAVSILTSQQPDEASDPDASDGGQEEQDDPGKGRSQRSGKRKHGPAPAGSKYKRVRFEDGAAPGGEDQAQDSQAEHIRVERALTRDIMIGAAFLAEIREINSIIGSILGQADQSLISQYMERTFYINTVDGKGNDGQEQRTYY